MSDQTSGKKPAGLTGFVIIQVVLLSAAMAATSHRMRTIDARVTLPESREFPLVVEPRHDNPLIVSDEQLVEVLNKLRPQLRGDQPKINHIDHALRMWGVSAKFADPNCLSGSEMRAILTDAGEFQKVWGDDVQPLLSRGPHGVRVFVRGGDSTSSHVDHTLAGLAEIGTPTTFVMNVAGRRMTLGQMLNESLDRFRLNQREYEWSALAYALFLPTDSWVTAEGQTISFDDIVQRITRQPYGEGVCFGNHRLHTLAMILRIDEQESILSTAARQSVVAHLNEATARLVASQEADGFWDQGWTGKQRPAASGGERQSRILATGHAMEWWAFAPAEVHPPREVLIRAGQWLARTIGEMSDEEIRSNYTYLTHAGRALALWRGSFPTDIVEPTEEQALPKTDAEPTDAEPTEPADGSADLDDPKKEPAGGQPNESSKPPTDAGQTATDKEAAS
ncbi:MAG: hypothetical protein QGG36_23755 [Pirellulaceae bacterium]|nr:hypothetical protein [Pirellulaceae bacterium]